MVTLAALRQPGATKRRRRDGGSARAARIATALWIVWAAIVWNVVFDQAIVLAGQDYVHAAVVAANGPGPYARIDDWMRPAVARAFWMATAAATVLLICLVTGLRVARSSPPAAQPL